MNLRHTLKWGYLKPRGFNHMKIKMLVYFAALVLIAAQAIAQSPPRLRTPFVEGWDQVPPAKLAQQASDFPKSFFLEGPSDRKEIALTFDDGPSRDTAALLDLLKKENVKATFFWQGSQIEKFPELARRAYAEGHTLANHSYNHPRLIPLEDGNQWWTQQIEKTQAIFQNVLGFQPSMMRPPYGFISDQQVQNLQQKKCSRFYGRSILPIGITPTKTAWMKLPRPKLLA
jgi:peptidoglycan/xylan/chitin deacetylase (PgdA/CDA1 family)